ncbi:hypothetical protein HK105_205792 [Polyrhizophydium stewartii]|uniref:Uncharacterized protein n=1 Tax=Polyrhizophydium stewartii TaxID=2732419 RepID=A0ABR4N577_9FUNG
MARARQRPPISGRRASRRRGRGRSLAALSAGARPDAGDDCFAIVPPATLVLALCKDSYEAAGLQGRPARAAPSRSRHVVRIDLARPSFRPGDKTFDRVAWCFANVLVQPVDWLLVSLASPAPPAQPTPAQPTPAESSPAESSHAAPLVWRDFALPAEANARPVIADAVVSTMTNVVFPDLAATGLPAGFAAGRDGAQDSALALLEWVGLACIRAQRLSADDAVDPFVAAIDHFEPSTTGDVATISWSGLITPPFVGAVVCAAARVLADNPALPWFAVAVSGFPNAPVSWDGKDHGSFVHGENDLVLVVDRSDMCLSFTMQSAADGLK